MHCGCWLSTIPPDLAGCIPLSDETYSLLHLIVEHSYLKQYHASFGEHFYQLKRVLVDQIRTSSKRGLPTSCHLRSLACLVLFPYVKAKCDLFYEELRDKADVGLPPMSRWKARCCRVFLAMYPIVHLTWEGAMLCFHIAYLFGWSSVHNPLLKVAGVILKISEDDRQTHTLSAPLKFKHKSWLQTGGLLADRVLAVVASALSRGLSVSVFLLQFLEWWYRSDRRSESLTNLPVPPPPTLPVSRDVLPRLNSVCPLCHKLRTNDTVLAVTGFVYCYPCIYHYLKENNTCPLTGYPAHIRHLVRLYRTEAA
ncbi:Peroxisome assembly protein 12 [Lamellibrachia satsuma]|nr:Peroxisome assembly protein 12 [Lamellibrachia satsuma]